MPFFSLNAPPFFFWAQFAGYDLKLNEIFVMLTHFVQNW
jgi:hypothetical protein